MTLRQLLATLIGRKYLFLGTMGFFILAALLAYVVMPKAYTGSASVVVDMRTPDPIAGIVLSGTPTYMATQQDIINSERVARLVVKRLKLNEVPELRQQWIDSTESTGDFTTWLTFILRKNLLVKPSRESNVIEISYTGADGQFAATVTNAFVQAYLDTSVELRVEPAKQYRALFEAQTNEFRNQLEKAQAKLSAYQQEHGLIETNERYDVEIARLAQLSSELVAAQSMANDAHNRQKSAGPLSPEVLANPVIAGLKSQLARDETVLKQLSSRLGDNNPQIIQASAGIAELKARIDAETAKVTGSLGVNNNTFAAREAEIRSQLSAQHAKVLRIKQVRDEAQLLARDVESAQRGYDGVMARASQSSLESQASQTSVALLKPATAPFTNSSPNLFLNMAIAIFLGLFTAVSLVFSMEYFDRRVRLVDDITEVLGVNFLGEMPKVSNGGNKAAMVAFASKIKLGRRGLPQLPAA